MKKFVFLLLFVLLLPAVFGQKEIIITSNQSDYYFLVGSGAVVTFDVDNEFNEDINGIATYTITTEINQNGAFQSQTNTQSVNILIKKDAEPLTMDFGNSDTPVDIILKSLKISFDDPKDGDKLESEIKDVSVHFVESEEEEQQQNQQQQEQQEQKESEQTKQKQQKSETEQQQQSETEQKLQNNQQTQDMNSLKDQMSKDMQTKEQAKQEFAKNLEQNEVFREEHQKMAEKGYEMSDGEIDAQNNQTGDFEFEYKNKDGDKETISGQMKNNSLQNIDNSLTKKEAIEKVKQNSDFQEYNEQLKQDGFKLNNFSMKNNNTIGDVNYVNNETNMTARIPFKANETDVQVDEPIYEKDRNGIWWVLLIIGLVAIGGSALLFRKKEIINETVVVKDKKIDYVKEAKKMIEEAKVLFEKKEYKESYAKSSYAIRYYYSNKLGLLKEMTAYDTIKKLKELKAGYKDARDSLNLCSLVEFAKYKPNEKDFNKIIK